MNQKSLKAPSVDVILLNWNNWKDTIECLESLLHLDYPNYKIIVCDNDSTDGSMQEFQAWANGSKTAPMTEVESLKRLTPVRSIEKLDCLFTHSNDLAKHLDAENKITIIQTGANLGFAGGNNVGLQYSLDRGVDYCWMLNNDTLVEPNCLSELIKYSEELTKQGIKNTCGTVQCFYDDPTVVQALGGFSFNKWTSIASETFGRFLKIDSEIDHKSFEERLDAIHGCSWLLSRDFLNEIGLMEEQYFLFYEEIDWCLRCKDKYKLAYAPKAIVYHKEGSSIGYKKSKKNSVMSEYYSQRNKLLVADKFFAYAKPTITFWILVQAAKKLLKGQFNLFWTDVQVAFGKRTLK